MASVRIMAVAIVAMTLHAAPAVAQSDTDPSMPDTAAMARAHLARAIGPEGLAGALVSSGLAQIRREPETWESNARGFGRRYASALGTGAVDEGVQFAVGAWLEIDTRYQRRGQGRLLGRVAHAARAVVAAKRRDGRWGPAWTRFAGAGAASAVSTAWYPEPNGRGRHIVSQSLSMLGGDLFSNLWEEFREDVVGR